MVDNSSKTDLAKTDQIASILERLAGSGQTLKLEGNRSIGLNKPGSVYFVGSGYIDIFAIRNPDADVLGPRLNIMRVEPGQLIFGLSADEKLHDIGFIGVSGGRTELLEMTIEDFLGQVVSADVKATFISMIETWVKGLLDPSVQEIAQCNISPDIQAV